MILATIKYREAEVAGLYIGGGLIPLPAINEHYGVDWPIDLFSLIGTGKLDAFREWTEGMGHAFIESLGKYSIALENAGFSPLFRRPRKIWGIGLNYRDHAADLSETAPTAEPASFMKPDTTIIGYGDTINIPHLSLRTTGEAELGLVFGKTCKDVPREDWQSVIAGYTTIIDMTAEDILRRNPRNLTQSKSFDTFFSFGPFFYTTHEVEDIDGLQVATIINGEVHAKNVVANMTFPPDYLVCYHSQIMTMLPGDIISTGTPGAVPLHHGDIVECRIHGFFPLVNKVRDLKVQP